MRPDYEQGGFERPPPAAFGANGKDRWARPMLDLSAGGEVSVQPVKTDGPLAAKSELAQLRHQVEVQRLKLQRDFLRAMRFLVWPALVAAAVLVLRVGFGFTSLTGASMTMGGLGGLLLTVAVKRLSRRRTKNNGA